MHDRFLAWTHRSPRAGVQLVEFGRSNAIAPATSEHAGFDDSVIDPVFDPAANGYDRSRQRPALQHHRFRCDDCPA